MTTEKEKCNYDILRHQLLLMATEFSSCEYVINNINEIKDKKSFKRAYTNTFEEVASHFGVDLAEDLEYEVSRLESKIDRLECDIEDLQEKYGEIQTLSDQYKVEFYIQHSKEYTEWELKELLENGKYFLSLNNKLKVA